MKKFLVLSLLLHLLPFAIINLHNGSKNSRNGTNKGTEVAGANTQDIEIVSPQTGGDQPKPRDYFWGIGIMSGIDTEHCNPFGVKVNDVYDGYSASAAGIHKGDAICEINGEQVTDTNDIAGKVPKNNMVFTIVRDKVTIYIRLNRVKVYYDGGR